MLIPQPIFAISKLCDTTAIRYALGSVRLERDEDNQPHAVATDGLRLISCQWAEAPGNEYPTGFDTAIVPGFSTLVPKKQWEEASKLPPKRCPKPILSEVVVEEGTANGKITLGATDLETVRKITATVPDMRYIHWRDTIPQRKPHQEALIGIDSQLAAELLGVFKGLTDDAYNKVAMSVPVDGQGPIKFTATHNGITTTAVLMPVALDEDDKRVKAQREKAAANYIDTIGAYSEAMLWDSVAPLLSDSQKAELVRRLPADQAANLLTPEQISNLSPE